MSHVQDGFAVNGRFLSQPVTGVQRYALSVTRGIDAILASQGRKALVVTPPGCPAPAFEALDVLRTGPGSGHPWEQAVLPVRWRGPLLSLCNTGPLARAEQVLCVHDANVFRAPESYGRGFRTLYRTLQPMLAARVARVTTVSGDSARQVAEHLSLRVEDVLVLPNGHEHALSWDPSRSTVLAAQPQDRPFVLALGSRARHKNLSLLVGLAPELDALGLDLLVAGGGAGIFAAHAQGTAPNVRHLGTVTDDDLALLMGRATCLAFPSLTEGFGLPIVEAMALGCPVVSSDRASMPEVCGDAALMASPEDPAAWRDAFSRLASSPSLGRELADRGRQQVRRFSWDATARGYLDAMASIGGSPSRVAPRPVAAAAPGRSLRVAVAVATRGRPEVVERTVRHLVDTQAMRPVDVVVSCCSPLDAGTCPDVPGVRVIESAPGLAAQRNAALAALAPDVDVVVFFDDDFVADPGWLRAAADRFSRDPDVVALTGTVLADEVKGPGLSFDEALAIVRDAPAGDAPAVESPYSPYGCNMAFRMSAVGDLRFDERLVLYGWLEDRDFGAALVAKGGVAVRIAAARGVHMGAKGGRSPGDRLGYSQVANPIYMNRKGTMRLGLVADHLFRNVSSNLLGSLRPEPHVDRLGRLRGNARAALDLATGRLVPERAVRPTKPTRDGVRDGTREGSMS